MNGAQVTNVLFTVELNGSDEFGPGAFKDEERWLAISVACQCFDFDGSGAVDLLDFAELQVVFGG